MFNNTFKNKKVLVTGNTGFKGSWLTVWLLQMEAQVYGISIDIPTSPSMFITLGLEKKITHHFADINDLKKMTELIESIKPEFVFHLAAQPIVITSYTNPVETFQTNVIGTANILEALRISNHSCTAILISSDKCYENVEWTWGYRETDHLGGKDPYSASKGACEVVIHSYYHSFFRNNISNVRIASARSGNVIGGGDWAEKRLVPDCMQAWAINENVEIRNPNSIRPWQHVLEPLCGYLCLAEALNNKIELNGEAYNFGPPADQVSTVAEIINELNNCRQKKDDKINFTVNQSGNVYEAGFLKLNCDKALAQLNWKPVLDLQKTAALTVSWYESFYKKENDMYSTTDQQIEQFIMLGKKKNMAWAK